MDRSAVSITIDYRTRHSLPWIFYESGRHPDTCSRPTDLMGMDSQLQSLRQLHDDPNTRNDLSRWVVYMRSIVVGGLPTIYIYKITQAAMALVAVYSDVWLSIAVSPSLHAAASSFAAAATSCPYFTQCLTCSVQITARIICSSLGSKCSHCSRRLLIYSDMAPINHYNKSALICLKGNQSINQSIRITLKQLALIQGQ